MDNISKFTKEKVVGFPEGGELASRLRAVIDSYDELALASIVGVLEIVKLDLIKEYD